MYIVGPDSEKFLQGQCSIDIPSLPDNDYRLGTLNDPKGRIYSFFKIVRYQNGLLLCMDAGIYEHTRQTLAKYAVFFKCDITELELNGYGLLSAQSTPTGIDQSTSQLIQTSSKTAFAQNDDTLSIKLPHSELIEIWTPKKIDDNKLSDSPNAFLAQYFSAGLVQLQEQTAGKFILQELNLQHLNAVSFKKGCYTGQEIIARMKYLGKLKKQMFLLRQAQAFNIPALASVSLSSTPTQNIGKTVCSTHTESGGTYVLAVLNNEQLAGALHVRIDGHETNFEVCTLRYE